jgi:hypothetical protein
MAQSSWDEKQRRRREMKARWRQGRYDFLMAPMAIAAMVIVLSIIIGVRP